MLKKTLKGLALLLCCALVGYLLLVLSYCVPTERVRSSYDASAEFLREEGERPKVDRINRASQLDNYTDALMLSIAYDENDGSAWDRAVIIPWKYLAEYDGEAVVNLDAYVSFIAIHDDPDIEQLDVEYMRYWHGYLVLLRPLLTFLTYPQVRMLYAAGLVLLFAAQIVLLLRRKRPGIALALVIAALFLSPLAVLNSMQYSSASYATAFGMLAVLLCRKRERLPYLFLLTGALTAYLDLLTFPMLALTMPLALETLLSEEKNWKALLGRLFVLTLGWGVGYAGMWISKWFIAWVVGGNETLHCIMEGAIGHSLFRIGLFDEATEPSRLLTMYTCAKRLGSNLMGTGLTLVCAVVFAIIIKPRNWLSRILNRRAAALALIALIPIVWMLLLGNHTRIHHWMTYRNLVVLPFAGLTLLTDRPRVKLK